MFNISRTVATAITYSIPILLLGANSALADRRDFTVHNNSRLTIQYLYVSDSGSNTWGSDVLGADTVLESGESTLVYFTDNSSNCFYDIKAVAENGAELDDRQVNLCGISDYYITGN